MVQKARYLAVTSKQAPSLQSSVSELKGVGPKMVENLQKIGIQRIQDLLFHLPLRYQDRTRIYPIGSLLTCNCHGDLPWFTAHHRACRHRYLVGNGICL